jgi:hypothetical protein
MQQSSSLIPALLLIFAAATSTDAQSDPPVPKEAAAAAQAMVDRFVSSWNRADGVAYGENHWPDAESASLPQTVPRMPRACSGLTSSTFWRGGTVSGRYWPHRIRSLPSQADPELQPLVAEAREAGEKPSASAGYRALYSDPLS